MTEQSTDTIRKKTGPNTAFRLEANKKSKIKAMLALQQVNFVAVRYIFYNDPAI